MRPIDAEDAELPEALRSAARSLFPPGTVAVCIESCRMVSPAEACCPEEAQAVACSCDARRNQYLAGRRAAHAALRELGAPEGPLLQTAGGDAAWPAGWTGSITHTANWCLAAVAATSCCRNLGLDLEEIRRMTVPVARRILLPEEQEQAENAAEPFLHRAALLFSAKEALYKTVASWMTPPPGFRDVRLAVDGTGALRHLRAELVPPHSKQADRIAALRGCGTFCGPCSLAAFYEM